MAQLVIEKKIENDVYIVTISVTSLTQQEQDLIRKYGDPLYTFGGIVNINDTNYFDQNNPAQSSASFTVARLTRRIVSETPITYKFDSSTYTQPLENANDFIRKTIIDITNIWTLLKARTDTFSSTQVINLP